MLFESKWYQTPNAVVVLTMDSATATCAWIDVQASINAGEALPDCVRIDTYGLPDEGVDIAVYAETCKTESIRLAEHEASQTATPATVTLLD